MSNNRKLDTGVQLNGQLTATEARTILETEAAKPNEQPPITADVTPQEVMQQVAELLLSLGYDGLGVIVVTPKFETPVSPYEFVPDGWLLRVVPTKKD